MAKQMGLLKLKNKASFEKWNEMSRRSQETGKEIHRINVENSLRQQDKQEQDKTNEELQKMVDSGVPESDALKKLQE